MSSNPENPLEFLVRHHNYPVTILVILALAACGYQATQEPTQSKATPSNNYPLATLPSADTTNHIITPNETVLPGGRRLNPLTGTFYPYANIPEGYEDWDCFVIPSGGTSYGAVQIAGVSPSKLDSREAAIFVRGNNQKPERIDLTEDPINWTSVVNVVPGTIACSQ